MRAFMDNIHQSVKSRELAVKKWISSSSVEDAIRLSGCPGIEQVESLIRPLAQKGDFAEFYGKGIEFGAGMGVLSASMLRLSDEFDFRIGKLVAVESCKPYVEIGINKTAKYFLGQAGSKLVAKEEDFENLTFISGEFDFGIQIESLHHADNIEKAVSEIYRVLKSGGMFLSIDRSWPNSVSEETLEEMLNHEYGERWLKEKGFADSGVLRRRDNGEHEYRDFEWEKFFNDAGFVKVREYKSSTALKSWKLKKSLASLPVMRKLLKIKVPIRYSSILAGLEMAVFKKNRISILSPVNSFISNYPRDLQIQFWRKP